MKDSGPKKKRINPIDVVMMTIFGAVTTGVGAMVALAVPVAVIVFIVLPIFPSTSQLVESYVCDPGGIIEIEEWREYDHEDQVYESGTDFLCVYEDGTWTESSTEILIAMLLIGILVPGALAGAAGAFLGFLGGISPNEKKKKEKKKKKKQQPKQAKRAETDEEKVNSATIQTPSKDPDAKET